MAFDLAAVTTESRGLRISPLSKQDVDSNAGGGKVLMIDIQRRNFRPVAEAIDLTRRPLFTRGLG